MNNTPTRGSNTLDIFVTDRPYLFEPCDIVSGISGHETLLVKSLVTACISYSYKRTIYLWSRADYDVIRNILYRISSLCEEFTTKYTHPHLLNPHGILSNHSNISNTRICKIMNFCVMNSMHGFHSNLPLSIILLHVLTKGASVMHCLLTSAKHLIKSHIPISTRKLSH